MLYSSTLDLPSWIKDFSEESLSKAFKSLEERMRLVLDACKQNIANHTGGPFAAGIFEANTGKLISIGVNRVVPLSNSIAHAEMMAFTMAHAHYQHYDLGSHELPNHQLVSSAQMCAMCCGAVVWSGVKSVVYSATAADVESIVGFDEGPLHPQWILQLEKRGIKIHPEIMREEACHLLRTYQKEGGIVYNGRQSA